MGASPLIGRDDFAPTESVLATFVPHVVAWNLTRRCNLECAHCYISAGPSETAEGELSTSEVKRIAGEILELNPSPMFILSGGEPLLRADLSGIASHAAKRGATVVVGTNGTLIDADRLAELKDSGVTGIAVSVDSLAPHRHDAFRHSAGALEATAHAIELMAEQRMDFVIQTTVTRGNRRELERLAEWSAEHGAVSFNAYFLVKTGRGSRLTDLAPGEYEESLALLVDLHRRYMGRMMVRAKCAPHFMRHLHATFREDAVAADSPLLHYESRCPCGIQYCRITPDGKLTPCPYLPEVAGDLRTSSFEEVWSSSQVFTDLRGGPLGGKCGSCEYRRVCGGCRARAYAATGDYMAEDPSCAYQPPGDVPLVLPKVAVTYGMKVDRELHWSPEAEARVARIPSFVRGVVVSRVEEWARARGLTEITADTMAEVRRSMPVDFSKRLPFFVRDD